MKEKINLLSKGVFEYENPEISVSEQAIDIEVEQGSRYTGYFDVNSQNHIEIRAMIFSSSKSMQCIETTIIGMNNRVHYVFDSKGMELEDYIEGFFSVVSNGGELQLPFHVTVCAPFVVTSIGRINELDQFATLAQSSWAEALKIFKSSEFKHIFLNNKKNAYTYDCLIKSHLAAQAMEEFLCTVKRKKHVVITVSQDIIECAAGNQDISGKLLIERSQWGYVTAEVRTEGDCISVYKKQITSEDFLGSYYQLEYVVHPTQRGGEHGKLLLETFDGCIEIPVYCQKNDRRADEVERRTAKSALLEVYRLFLKLQMNKMTREEWIPETREAIDACLNNSEDPIYRLLEGHFSLIANEKNQAREILTAVNGRELRHRSVVLHAYYQYVMALYKNDSSYTSYIFDNIRFYVEGRYADNWPMLFILLQMNERYAGGPGRLYKRLKLLYEKGCTSPFLLYEAIRIINRQPSQLREMGHFEKALLIWGTRHECLDRDTILQFADLTGRVRSFQPQLLRIMMNMCELYETKELLIAVLHLLILGGKKDKQYNNWYLLGINSSLKIPELYEYYMDSLAFTENAELPKAVLIYFAYDNSLRSEQKAFLYSYVVRRRERDKKSFEMYENIIRTYTMEQLKAGRISKNLSVLYAYFLTKPNMTAHVVEALPEVIFKYQIYCDKPGIKGVYVSHREVDKESWYPMTEGYAYVDLYMDDYRLAFADAQEHRYTTSVPFVMERLLDAGQYIKACYEQCQDNRMILMNRSERALKYQLIDDSSIDIYKQTLKLKDVSRKYQKTILKNLVDFYYDNYEGETLEKYLLKIDLELLGHEERNHIIEYFIQRGLYDRAYKAITNYGFEGLQEKRIMRLSSRIIRETDHAEDMLLVQLAYQAFGKAKYDEAILKYLIRYYTGTTGSLYEIWKAARDFEVDAFELEERLICEILFTESYIDEGCDVFASYYKSNPSERLVKAFLAFYAYQYLVNERVTRQSIFQYMEIELEQMGQARDVCGMAILKYYAGIDHVDSDYYSWIYSEIAKLMDKGVVLPFFKKFAAFIEVPEELVDLTYVEYHANPNHSVRIQYQILDEGEHPDQIKLQSSEMRHVFGGIFIKAFRLFNAQMLYYEITECGEEQELHQGRQQIQMGSSEKEASVTGIDALNRMTDYIAFSDDLALDHALADYDRKQYMAQTLFTLM